MKKCFFILIVLSIISCNRLEEGVVVEKEIEPERNYTRMQHIQIGKVATYIPVQMYDDEDYKIKVHGTIKEQEVYEMYYISKEQFDTIKNGDFICLENCNKDPNNDIRD